MEPSESQFKSLSIFRKGNEDDDNRLAARAEANRMNQSIANSTWHEDKANTQYGPVQGTKGTPMEAGLQKWAWNTKVSDLSEMPLRGSQRPDVIEEGKKRYQSNVAGSKLKKGERFYRSGGK